MVNGNPWQWLEECISIIRRAVGESALDETVALLLSCPFDWFVIIVVYFVRFVFYHLFSFLYKEDCAALFLFSNFDFPPLFSFFLLLSSRCLFFKPRWLLLFDDSHTNISSSSPPHQLLAHHPSASFALLSSTLDILPYAYTDHHPTHPLLIQYLILTLPLCTFLRSAQLYPEQDNPLPHVRIITHCSTTNHLLNHAHPSSSSRQLVRRVGPPLAFYLLSPFPLCLFLFALATWWMGWFTSIIGRSRGHWANWDRNRQSQNRLGQRYLSLVLSTNPTISIDTHGTHNYTQLDPLCFLFLTYLPLQLESTPLLYTPNKKFISILVSNAHIYILSSWQREHESLSTAHM